MTYRELRITRPVGRVRIETPKPGVASYCQIRITRPVGRVRIETYLLLQQRHEALASPGRLAGCGLKHRSRILCLR